MAAVGFAWCISGLAVGPPTVRLHRRYLFGTSLPFALLFHMLLAFPTGRLETRFAAGRGAGLLRDDGPLVGNPPVLRHQADDWASNPMQAFDEESMADVAALRSELAGHRSRWSASRASCRAAGGARLARSAQVLTPVYAGGGGARGAPRRSSLVGDVAPMPELRGDGHRHRRPREPHLVPFAFLGGPAAQPALARRRGERAGGAAVRARPAAAGCATRWPTRSATRASRWPTGCPARGQYVNADGQPVELPDRRLGAGGHDRRATTARRWPRSFTTPRSRTSAS